MMELLRRDDGDSRGFTIVELLVVMLILGIVLAGITSVVISSLRVEQDQRQLQEVIDDGRLALTRIRQEARSARRILPGSNGSVLYFWVDKNQDALVQPEELICYVVEGVDAPKDEATRFQISRWTGALAAEDCEPDADEPGRTVVAKTLLNDQPFVEYLPEVSDVPQAPATREIFIELILESDSERGPDSITVEGSVRLRNVP